MSFHLLCRDGRASVLPHFGHVMRVSEPDVLRRVAELSQIRRRAYLRFALFPQLADNVTASE